MIKNVNVNRPTKRSITSRVTNMSNYMGLHLELRWLGRRARLVFQPTDDKLATRDISQLLTTAKMAAHLDGVEEGYYLGSNFDVR